MQKDAQSVSQDLLPTDSAAMMCSDVAVSFSRTRPGLSRHFPWLIFSSTQFICIGLQERFVFGSGRLRIIFGSFQLWLEQANSAVLEKGAVGSCAIDRNIAANTPKIAMFAAKR